MAKQAVNGWFADLVTGAAKPIFQVLSQTALGTPPLDSPHMARAKDLWGVSQTIANTCYVLLVTVGGVLLIAGHSLPGSELTPGQLVARLVGAFAASNLSLVLIGYAIVFANGLSGAFLKAGAEAIDPGRVAKAIAGYLVASLIPNQPYTIFIGLGVVVLALCVVFIYIAEARAYRFSLTLAHHTAPLLAPHDLSHLGAYQAAARLMDGSAPTPAFTFRTRPLPDPISGRAAAVRRASREQYAAGRGKRLIPAVGLRDLAGVSPSATESDLPVNGTADRTADGSADGTDAEVES